MMVFVVLVVSIVGGCVGGDGGGVVAPTVADCGQSEGDSGPCRKSCLTSSHVDPGGGPAKGELMSFNISREHTWKRRGDKMRTQIVMGQRK
jgi:hypothetical protein